MEAFSTVIRELDLHCVTARRLRLPSTWAARGPDRERAVYAMLNGRCEVVVPGQPDGLFLRPGDVAVLARGDSHVLRSASGPWPDPVRFQEIPSIPREAWWKQAGADETRLIRGTFAFGDTLEHPVIATLPATIVLRGGL